MSGLKTIKRDWSESSPLNDDAISWDLAPPPLVTKSLSGAQQRLKDIQDALAGRPVASERVLANASSHNKRLAKNVKVEDPPAKRRLLTTTPKDSAKSPAKSDDILSTSTEFVASHAPVNIPPPDSIVKATKKLAPVFLSAEQTQIKKLVEEGHSVFYTGSAGTNHLLSFTPVAPFVGGRNGQISSSARDHQVAKKETCQVPRRCCRHGLYR